MIARLRLDHDGRCEQSYWFVGNHTLSYSLFAFYSSCDDDERRRRRRYIHMYIYFLVRSCHYAIIFFFLNLSLPLSPYVPFNLNRTSPVATPTASNLTSPRYNHSHIYTYILIYINVYTYNKSIYLFRFNFFMNCFYLFN